MLSITVQRLVSVLSLAVLLHASDAGAQATNCPGQTVTIVAPVPPGGAIDLLVREFAPRLAKATGQTVIVENHNGGSGMVGAAHVLSRPADGCTLIASLSSKTTIRLIEPSLKIDPMKDFTPVAMLGVSPVIIVASPSSGIKDFNQFKEFLAKADGNASWGSTGTGLAPHLAGETLLSAINAKATHVPYRGGPPMHLDLLPGRLAYGLDGVTNVLALIQAGKLVPIAVVGQARAPQLPNVPTLGELGVSDFTKFVYDGWTSIDVRSGTPSQVVQSLSREISTLLANGEFKEKALSIGMRLFPPNTSQEAQKTQDDIVRRVTPIVSQVAR
jgi:tripartite-type tricarboxylate transporter receptor subunit TctC